MAYKKHEWKARQGTGLNKFRDQNGNIYEFEAAPDEVTQPGTPFSAEWMNEMEEGIAAAGITSLVSTAPSGATTILITENAPDAIANNDNFRILFENEVGAGATLNLGNTGAYPIIDNYTGAAIVKGDVPADYIGDIMFEDGKFLLLNALRVSGTPTGSAFFTQDGTFTVPNFVTSIKVSACAAGIGRYAGEYLIDRIFNVTPGQTIELTIGSGNTVIGELTTLIAGSVASATPTTKLGYAAGYNGGNGFPSDASGNNSGGYGGAFGFGGGAGGSYNGVYNDQGSGGGGAGIGGAGASATTTTGGGGAGAGGGTTGGAGGSGRYRTNTNERAENGNDARSGKIIYMGAKGDKTTGGGGSIYGAGGGGGGNETEGSGGGGAAGGYGAGGGRSGKLDSYGQPSNGMVLIEWGGTVA